MEFRAGQVLARTFSALARNIVGFTLLAVVFLGPFAIPQVASYSLTHPWTYRLIQITLVFLLQATVVYSVFMHLSGERPGVGKALAVGLSRLLPVLGVVIVLVLSVVGAMLPGFVLTLATRSPLVGTIAMYVPVLLVLMMFYVAIPVAVVERPGVMMSLKRAQELTEGHRWGLFGIFLVTFVLGIVVRFLLIRAAMTGSLGFEAFIVADGVLNLVFTLLYVVTTAVAYHDLRLEKDGVSVDELASVFE